MLRPRYSLLLLQTIDGAPGCKSRVAPDKYVPDGQLHLIKWSP